MPQNSPTILAIDSSSGACSVAVLHASKILSYIEELSATLQAKRLINMVEEALAESCTSYDELTKIAVTVGPGSFTGIRIALAAARGIGLAAKKPVVGYSGLLVLAYGARKSQKNANICAVLNAGKGEVIYQNFNAELSPLSEPTLGKPSAVLPAPQNIIPAKEGILVGYGCENNQTFPRADFLAMLASEHEELAVSPLPFYVRPPDAKLPS